MKLKKKTDKKRKGENIYFLTVNHAKTMDDISPICSSCKMKRGLTWCLKGMIALTNSVWNSPRCHRHCP